MPDKLLVQFVAHCDQHNQMFGKWFACVWTVHIFLIASCMSMFSFPIASSCLLLHLPPCLIFIVCLLNQILSIRVHCTHVVCWNFALIHVEMYLLASSLPPKGGPHPSESMFKFPYKMCVPIKREFIFVAIEWDALYLQLLLRSHFEAPNLSQKCGLDT